MTHALALRIGCTVNELLSRMSAAEFRYWIAYADLGDPWLDFDAETKQDLRTGVVGATLANLLGTGRKKYQPSDFAPKWSTDEAKKPEQTPDEMKRAAMKIAAAFRKRK